MKQLALVLFLIGTCGCTIATKDQKDDPIVGRWEDSTTFWLEFLPDGNMRSNVFILPEGAQPRWERREAKEGTYYRLYTSEDIEESRRGPFVVIEDREDGQYASILSAHYYPEFQKVKN